MDSDTSIGSLWELLHTTYYYASVSTMCEIFFLRSLYKTWLFNGRLSRSNTQYGMYMPVSPGDDDAYLLQLFETEINPKGQARTCFSVRVRVEDENVSWSAKPRRAYGQEVWGRLDRALVCGESINRDFFWTYLSLCIFDYLSTVHCNRWCSTVYSTRVYTPDSKIFIYGYPSAQFYKFSPCMTEVRPPLAFHDLCSTTCQVWSWKNEFITKLITRLL